MRRAPSVTFVVMAGGRGERLWPLVRAAKPKVCCSPDGCRTLLQATIERLDGIWPNAGWLIVTTREQADAVGAALPLRLRRAVLIEPETKNTAACIALAAAVVAARRPKDVLVIVPADHWIRETAAFRRAVRAAIRAAVQEQAIVTIGIRPTHPHPGFGYLCAGEPIRGSGSPPAFRLGRFVEKPSVGQARRLLARGRTYWNSGIFIGAAEVFLERVTEWLPDHASQLAPFGAMIGVRAPSAGSRPGGLSRRLRAAYSRLPAVSFDHGVMDHLRNQGVVVEGRFSWADLGSWDAWARLGRASSPAVAVESEHVTVIGQDGHLVATVGVRDLVIVHTPSATLVCRADRAQAVREVVRRLAGDPRLAAYR